MKILIFTGQNGWIGERLWRSSLPTNRFNILVATHPKSFMDDPKNENRFKNKDHILDWIKDETPDVVINTMAKTSVDGCESCDDGVWLSNAMLPLWMAESCVEWGVRLFIHLSTDYVFDKGPDCTTLIDERDQDYHPVNIYGITKLAGDLNIKAVYDSACDGELKARIVRTSSLFGPGKKTFVDYAVSQFKEGKPVNCLRDSFSMPTYSEYLCDYIDNMIEKEYKAGEDDDTGDELRYFKNCVNSSYRGTVSRFDMAVDTMQLASRHTIVKYQPDLVRAADASDFLAKRPAWSMLRPNTEYCPPRDYKLELNRHLVCEYCA
jgi:dTDP-4-dehydrorhamnose reductase